MLNKNKKDVKKDKGNNSNKSTKGQKQKKNTIKKIVTIAVLIAILTVVLYFAFKTLRPQQTLAEVNGEVITKQQLDEQYNKLPDQYKLFITKDDFLDQIINVKLLLQEAEEQEIVISEEEIESELELIKEQAETEEEFEAMLKQSNTNLGQLKKQISEQLIINKLLDDIVVSKATITDSQIREYFISNEEYFKENNLAYNEAKDQIEQMLLSEISNNAIQIYINQLRSGATIIKDGVEISGTSGAVEEQEEIVEETEEESEIESFTQTEDVICKENNKPILRFFSTTTNSASNWIGESFDEVVSEYDDVIAYHWQLDTGDNTLTDVEETGIPKEEVNIFQQYNIKNTVPTYVFGCKYVRVGNEYGSLEEEKEEFKRVIEELLA